MTTPLAHSGYPRRANDDYQTIDKRLGPGLLETWEIGGTIVDPCAPNGSGIVNRLIGLGYDARCADRPTPCDWLVTNPPYDRRIVDGIAEGILHAVESGAAHDLAAARKAEAARGRIGRTWHQLLGLDETKR